MTDIAKNQRVLSRRSFLWSSGSAALLASAGCDLLSTDSDEPGRDGQDGAARKPEEAPMLTELVEAGELPPVAERLPRDPLVIEPIDSIGHYGGKWNSWVLGQGSVFWLLVETGYENLVRWDPEWTTVIPNVAESWEIRQDGREYVFFLRQGMKWSDGEPFTADDLVFAYEDVQLHPDITGGTPSSEFLVQGEPASIEKIDDLTVRWIFPAPAGLFLNRLAQPARHHTLPRHYLEQFHIDYNEDAEQVAKDEGFDNWVGLFFAKDDQWVWRNPDRPVLDAWRVLEPVFDASDFAEVERNPYYWKVDPDGSQLPYLDSVSYQLIGDLEVALLKTTNGEIDFNRPTFFGSVCTLPNRPVLARNREQGDYHFVDGVASTMNRGVIALNLTHKNSTLREIFRNLDFRIGLSYAIDRPEIIDTAFLRQGEPWQAGPREESEFYHEELATQYTEYDVGRANQHLDLAGYTERDGDGFRLRPDGDRIAFTVEVTVEEPDVIDSLELIREYWKEVGIDMSVQTMDRTLFRARQEANEFDANVWTGDGGFGDVLLEPRWYFPYSNESNFALPWATWYQSLGEDGEEPPEPARRQMELYDQLNATVDKAEQRDLFMQILDIAQEQFWAIGTVLTVGIYGTVKNTFHNVPDTMPASWLYPTPGPTRPEQYYTSA